LPPENIVQLVAAPAVYIGPGVDNPGFRTACGYFLRLPRPRLFWKTTHACLILILIR